MWKAKRESLVGAHRSFGAQLRSLHLQRHCRGCPLHTAATLLFCQTALGLLLLPASRSRSDSQAVASRPDYVCLIAASQSLTAHIEVRLQIKYPSNSPSLM